MGEINVIAAGGQKAGVRRSKKLSTRVDLTPMVDLGFLLITFFIFTTRLSEPKAMRLILPADNSIDPPKLSALGALTVMPAAGEKLFYFNGDLEGALAAGTYGFTDYSVNNGIGKIVREKQQAMDHYRPGFRKDLMLLIKPTSTATYRQIIKILDEALIDGIPKYALLDPDEKEQAVLKEKEGVALSNK